MATIRSIVPGGADPNHHLWRNGRLWWVAFTVHHPDWTAERIRRSLRTADPAEARRRRDVLLGAYATGTTARLSLRFPPTDAARKGDSPCPTPRPTP